MARSRKWFTKLDNNLKRVNAVVVVDGLPRTDNPQTPADQAEGSADNFATLEVHLN